MRQKKMIIAVLAAMLLAIPAMVLSKKGETAKAQTLDLRSSFNRRLEVSFDYQRQPGPGSNQYAVWIENEKGDVVKTLFVTSYTTKGRARGNEALVRGYVKRPACVPTWVKTSKVSELSDSQVDAFTGATPQNSGRQTFTWDFTDQNGKLVAKGKYSVKVEATLFNASTIIYSGMFSTTDSAGDITLSSQITSEDEKHKDMVTNVKATLK